MVVMKDELKFLGVVEHWLYKIDINADLASYHFVLIVRKSIQSNSKKPHEVFVVEKEIIADCLNVGEQNVEVAQFVAEEKAIEYAASHFPRLKKN